MKVLNLQCGQAHGFEGWFASEDDFQSQLGRGLVACPVCGDTAIHKLPSAPRLNLGGGGEMVPGPSESLPAAEADQALQAAWLKAVRQVMASTEDVGERFVQEARRMHYGESEARAIRGQASLEQTVALLEEGIGVLPVPAGLKEPLQ